MINFNIKCIGAVSAALLAIQTNALQLTTQGHNGEGSVRQAFQDNQAKFGGHPSDSTEQAEQRFSLFVVADDQIKRLNAENPTVTFGHNKFSDMNETEMKQNTSRNAPKNADVPTAKQLDSQGSWCEASCYYETYWCEQDMEWYYGEGFCDSEQGWCEWMCADADVMCYDWYLSHPQYYDCYSETPWCEDICGQWYGPEGYYPSDNYFNYCMDYFNASEWYNCTQDNFCDYMCMGAVDECYYWNQWTEEYLGACSEVNWCDHYCAYSGAQCYENLDYWYDDCHLDYCQMWAQYYPPDCPMLADWMQYCYMEYYGIEWDGEPFGPAPPQDDTPCTDWADYYWLYGADRDEFMDLCHAYFNENAETWCDMWGVYYDSIGDLEWWEDYCPCVYYGDSCQDYCTYLADWYYLYDQVLQDFISECVAYYQGAENWCEWWGVYYNDYYGDDLWETEYCPCEYYDYCGDYDSYYECWYYGTNCDALCNYYGEEYFGLSGDLLNDWNSECTAYFSGANNYCILLGIYYESVGDYSWGAECQCQWYYECSGICEYYVAEYYGIYDPPQSDMVSVCDNYYGQDGWMCKIWAVYYEHYYQDYSYYGGCLCDYYDNCVQWCEYYAEYYGNYGQAFDDYVTDCMSYYGGEPVDPVVDPAGPVGPPDDYDQVDDPVDPVDPNPVDPNPISSSGIDWTDNERFPVYNQQCGDCWAHSAADTASWHVWNETGRPDVAVRVSRQQLVDCDKTQGGCNGGWEDKALDHHFNYGGISENDYTYKGGKETTCEEGQHPWQFTSSGRKRHVFDQQQGVNSSLDPWTLLKAALENGVTTIAVNVQTSLYYYEKGVLTLNGCADAVSGWPNHAIMAVGWGTEGGVDYVIVKNSWGNGWGENGYARIEATKGSGMGACQLWNVASQPSSIV